LFVVDVVGSFSIPGCGGARNRSILFARTLKYRIFDPRDLNSRKKTIPMLFKREGEHLEQKSNIKRLSCKYLAVRE